jgi:hypothetical protein
MRKTTALFIGAAVLVCGCAASTGVIDEGNGTFYASKQAATGIGGAANLKGEILTEASAFCAKRGQTLQVIDTTEAAPPFIFGNYPRAQIDFKCTARAN